MKRTIEDTLTELKKWAAELPDKRTCLAICSEDIGEENHRTFRLDSGSKLFLSANIVGLMMTDEQFAKMIMKCAKVYARMTIDGVKSPLIKAQNISNKA